VVDFPDRAVTCATLVSHVFLSEVTAGSDNYSQEQFWQGDMENGLLLYGRNMDSSDFA